MDETIRIDAGACVLRPFRIGDEEDLVAAANHREVWINLRDRFPHPYTRADALGWVAFAASQTPVSNLAITVGGRLVGGIGAQVQEDVYRLSAEVGYWLAPSAWGRGIATAALSAFAPWILERLDLRRLYADVFAWNPASGRVLEKCGFRLEGKKRAAAFKDGRFVDALCYGRVRDDVQDPASPVQVQDGPPAPF